MKRVIQHSSFKIGFAAILLVYLLAQYVSYWRNHPSAGCMDCGWQFGFPLPFYQYGGFVSYERVLWLGLFGDIAFAIVVALCGGVLTKLVWTKILSHH